MQVQFRGSFKHKILLKITQLSKTTLSMSDFPNRTFLTVRTPFFFFFFFFFYVGNGKILIIQGLRAAQYDSNKYCDDTFAITVRIQSYLRSIRGFV